MSNSLRPHGLQHARASLSFTVSLSLLKLTSVMPFNHLICCPLLLLPSIFPSIRVFSSESALRIWPKYWSFSFSISPSNEYSGLISFRIDWLDLLAVQGTLKNLLHHHSTKASILQCSAFFIVQLSHPHIALTRRRQRGKNTERVLVTRGYWFPSSQPSSPGGSSWQYPTSVGFRTRQPHGRCLMEV